MSSPGKQSTKTSITTNDNVTIGELYMASRRFHLINDYYNEDEPLYKKKDISLKSGVTVLVGCNGIGKTTMLHQIEAKLKEKKIPCIYYDNLHEGGSSSISEAMFYGDSVFGATAMCSSEGENIVMNMGKLASKLGHFIKTGESRKRSKLEQSMRTAYGVKEEAPEEPIKERWILLDAIDSGLSVDNIVDLKEYLFKVIQEHSKELGVDTYIVISANEYEMARNEQCFLVHEGKYVPIDSYEEYRGLVVLSREYKDKRQGIQEENSEQPTLTR